MRVITVLGPSQSGKTSLISAMAALEGGPKAKFDTSGAASLRLFSFMDEDWAAIDVVGGPDNIHAAGPAMAASDAVVLCVPPEAAAAELSAPYLRMIEEADIPHVIFINRLDQISERARDIVSALQAYSAHSIVLRQVPIREGGQVTGSIDLISERAWHYNEGKPSDLVEIPGDLLDREQEARTELLESLADFDDALLEQLIEDHRPMSAEVFEIATRLLQHNDLVPAFMGSASHGNGVFRLLKSLRHEAPGVEAATERLTTETQAVAVGCAADNVKHMGKTVVIRALGSGVHPGALVGGGTIGSLTELDAKTPVKSLNPGQIGLTVKTDHLALGQVYSENARAPLPEWANPRPANYSRVAKPSNERDEARLSGALERLAEIDTGLALSHDENSGHMVISTFGPLHLRRITDKLQADFGIEIIAESLPPAVRETISRSVEKHHRHRKQSGGAGQFADVVIEIRPEPRGAGFRFEEIVKGGAVPRNYISSVEAGVRDALVEGPSGFPVIDVSVTLKDGKHHAVDSSDYAFRTAGKNAMREALAEAGPMLLQPVSEIQIHVPSIHAGGLVALISAMKGQVLGFEGHPTAPGWDVFRAQLPAAMEDELFRQLGSATRGTAWFTSAFAHYAEARREELHLERT
ncbi:MAG: elongation factor G [Paracoccaceae bacterium]|nr:elongation factor G [Paracoccaceae bacterium]